MLPHGQESDECSVGKRGAGGIGIREKSRSRGVEELKSALFDRASYLCMQQRRYLLPLPHGHGSLRSM
jgi:hypothetical protein